MIVSVNAKQFTKVFEDFVKSGKIMFNFLCDGDSISIQLLAEFTAVVEVPCTYKSGDKKIYESSYYVANPIHILNDEEPIEIEFNDLQAVIKQGNFTYTLLTEFEARKELPEINKDNCVKLNTKRLQYLVSSADKMSNVAKELKTLPVEPMFINGHYYVRYSDIAFIDEFDFITDICIPYSTLKQVVPKLSDASTYTVEENGELLIICSGRYTFYLQAINFYLKGNKVSHLESLLLQSKKIAEISISRYAESLSKLLSTLQNQKYSLSVKDDKFIISATSSDNTATMFLGEQLNCPTATISLRTSKLEALVKLFSKEELIEVLLAPNVIIFKSGTKHLLISGLIY